MNNMKRYAALALCLLMAFSLMLCGCNGGKGNEPTLSADANYKVTVVDGLGNVYSQKVIVKLMQDGKQVAMGAVNAEGVFEKVLPRGDYDVVVDSTNSELECYVVTTKLTKDVTEVQAVMAFAAAEFESISVDSATYQAPIIDAGSSYVELDGEDRAYALFVPTQAGTYEFSVTNDEALVGYYGATHFIQSQNLAEMNGNKFTMSITADMIGGSNSGTTVLVIGLDAKEGVSGCILNIKRVGDPVWTIEQEPWQNYEAKAEIKDFKLDSGVTLVPIDVTASTDTYNLVYNAEDGTYHLGAADGPKVYVQLGNAVYGICMKDMVGEIVYDADGVLIATGTAPFRYQRGDTKENFFKEDYTDFMRQVVTAADKTTGVYPLTADLYYALPLGIDNKGWCREGAPNYLLNGVDDVNAEIAWMFMLCHADGDIPSADPDSGNQPVNPDNNTDNQPTGPIEDNKEEPIEIGSTLEFTAEVKANHIVYFNLFRVNDTTLTIKSKDAYVIYNGVKYEAKNGVVTVPDLYSQYTNLPVPIQIGNKGTKDASFAVTLSYPAGHRDNPIKLPMNAFSVDVKKNNDQGVYYQWKPTENGVLTVTLDQVTSKSGNVKGSITVTVSGADLIPYQYSLEEVEGNTLTINVKAGDNVLICVSVLPNEMNKYLAATMDVTASFA